MLSVCVEAKHQSFQLCFQSCRQYFVLLGIVFTCLLVGLYHFLYSVLYTTQATIQFHLSKHMRDYTHIRKTLLIDSCFKSKYVVAWFLIK